MASQLSGLVPLYQYQKEWISDKSRFKIANKGRQTGFSFGVALEVVLDAVEHKTLWVLLSRGERQSKELMEKVQMHAKAIGHVCEVIEDEFQIDDNRAYKMLELNLPNGSKIIGLPANPDTARGFSGNVVLDEFAFHRDSRKIWTALYPTITRGYKIRVISTPNGKSGKFYELWSGDNRWSKHEVDIYKAVADGLPIDIEELREGCDSEDDWLQEYCCEFLDEASAYLTYELIAGCECEKETSIILPEFFNPFGDLFLGLDIGRKKDLSVIWLWEKLGDVFYTRAVHELVKMKFRSQKKILYEYLRLLKLRRACIDCTGIGANLAEDAQLDFGKSRVEQVTFTSASKAQMAVNMKQIFEDKQARIPVVKAIRNDLHSVKKLVTAAGNIRYDADRNENGHADRFWAAALGLHAGQAEFVPVEYKSVAKKRFKRKGAY
ncbi:terminase large subunit domain-containing protein [Anaerosinus gibii]|uniref:Terminase family protein n=1 Tax=Selenobaculum gibii TaxID=3054208 RepID=A0A9Y2AJK1_9FIRM|nr:terminase family protein [Selenobaculum gbiensis]WIW70620.1 terminase family protein [Selenobaculum gbiensis]